MKLRIFLTCVAILAFAPGFRFLVEPAPTALAQTENLILVKGPTLQSRHESALKMALGRSQPAPFSVSYKFNARPGIVFNEALDSAADTESKSEDVLINRSAGGKESRDLVIVLRYDSNATVIKRMEIYDPARSHARNDATVYLLGDAEADESLDLLTGMVETNQGSPVIKSLILAMSLHNSSRVGAVLERLASSSSVPEARAFSAFWLGQITGERDFLASLARDEQQSIDVRKKAALAIAMSGDPQAQSTLQDLYKSVGDDELKRHIKIALSINRMKH